MAIPRFTRGGGSFGITKSVPGCWSQAQFQFLFQPRAASALAQTQRWAGPWHSHSGVPWLSQQPFLLSLQIPDSPSPPGMDLPVFGTVSEPKGSSYKLQISVIN
uniref:Uncharacterized protein n=1 Tax=Malurus cyaneus samueli TaxID=2593467 RepID=A0A8C5TMR1_9PASS